MPRPQKQLFCIHPPRKEGEKATWKEVGVGFVNNDGSVNIFLNHQPEVTYQLRDNPPKE